MTPYYDDGTCVIYHGDCREILPCLSVDALVADPPYGIGYRPLRGADGSKRWLSGVRGDEIPFDPAPFLVEERRMVWWGANHYASRLPDSAGWLVWDKTPRGSKKGFYAAELAWTNCVTSVRKFALQWGGEARNSEAFFHPTQKPVALLLWVLELCPAIAVCDPFMGSGTTLVAAKQLGRRAIGIEIEERYCEIAAKRLAQEVLPLGETG